jgi:hypothetical protein
MRGEELRDTDCDRWIKCLLLCTTCGGGLGGKLIAPALESRGKSRSDHWFGSWARAGRGGEERSRS